MDGKGFEADAGKGCFDMQEQRRSRRIPVTMYLEVSSVFKQDNVKVDNINAPIQILDVSKNGIGFISESILPLGYYFNCRLTFREQDESLNCVVQIVRQKPRTDGKNIYGCEFVGMASVFDYIFEGIEESYDKK